MRTLKRNAIYILLSMLILVTVVFLGLLVYVYIMESIYPEQVSVNNLINSINAKMILYMLELLSITYISSLFISSYKNGVLLTKSFKIVNGR